MLEANKLHKKEYIWDFAEDGGATGNIELRPADGINAELEDGVLVLDAVVVNEGALTGAAAVTFGTETDPDGFMVDCIAKVGALHAACRVGEVDGALLFDTTADAKKAHYVNSAVEADTKVVMRVTSAPLTAGRLRLILDLYKPSSAVGL